MPYKEYHQNVVSGHLRSDWLIALLGKVISSPCSFNKSTVIIIILRAKLKSVKI